MVFDVKDKIQPFAEKVWFKNDGTNSIVTGYTLRGRQKFKASVEGFIDIFKKGFSSTINGIDFRVLDIRKVGVAHEVEVQMKDKNETGIAMLKLYGPYDQKVKKDNVVMIQKRKQNDEKFVSMLAEKIVKPLIHDFAKREEIEVDIEKEKSPNMFKCSQCEKTSTSLAGIKVHVTRKHKDEKCEYLKPNNDELFSEANKVVNLLNEVVVISEDEESIEDVTLEEDCDLEECELVKKYVSKCDLCGYDVTTTKKYLGIQIIAKHKEACIKRNCVECGYYGKDKSTMKRHMRDEHGSYSISTSPPTKRKRKSEQENISLEQMDVEEEEVCVAQLSLSMEDMDIDDEEKVLEERKRYQDEKIKSKELKQEKKELEIRRKKIDELEQKKKEEEKKAKDDQNEKRKKKQKVKDKKKKLKQKSHKKENKVFKVKNIKEVPENCKHLVSEDDVVYEVPGDGACGPNSGAAHLFEDENEGPKLRLSINRFMAKHWDRQYKYLTQCSPETPFIRKVKGRTVKFTDPAELIQYLNNSQDAAFMWTDSEDLKVLADMYQVRIKVITTKGPEDRNVTVNWICPDESMKEFAVLKNVMLNDITLLHENDNHFNLVVNKNSDIAVKGSVTQRLLAGFEMEEKETNIKAADKSKTTETKNMSEVEIELQNYKKSLELIEAEYKKCEKELKLKTEEAEKYKIEIKDLRKIIELGKEFENDSDTKFVQPRKRKFSNKSSEVGLDAVLKNDPKVFKCTKCTFTTTGKDDLEKHMKSHNGVDFGMQSNLKTHINSKHEMETESREEFNCMDCPFQGSTEMQLTKHINLKHTLKGMPTSGTIKCKICGEEFSEKWNLMMHRKSNHINAVAFCKNYKNGECRFTSEACFWNHEKSEHTDGVACYFCGKVFRTKREMMIHRKREHKSLIENCQQFLQGICRFQENFCWFIHSRETESSLSSKSEEFDNFQRSVFQKESTNLEPPLTRERKSYAEVI